MTPNLLAKYIARHSYDIRRSKNGRWIDQKCAFDNLCFVSDCIVEYLRNGGAQPFSSPDIWKSQYAVNNVQAWFGKPDPLQKSTMDEYNKFYRQPKKLLAAAGVLEERKIGGKIEFRVANIDILEYIAQRERNSFDFLCQYIEKTLLDSGLSDSFESFFDMQDKDHLQIAKKKFVQFCIDNTPINTEIEANRIFIKVLNPLACKYHKKGIVKGRVSTDMITFDKIVYNQPNWRDIRAGKNKNVSRGDYDPTEKNKTLHKYKVSRASKNLRRFNDNFNNKKSEVLDKYSVGREATHMHHIFPQSQFPEIADSIENLIALTTAQHMQCAHPDGNTQVVDKDYQYICLINKVESIRKNTINNQGEPIIYDFKEFMSILDIGFKTSYFCNLKEDDFESILKGIEVQFS
ncbi:hypothetical protein [Rheinheimera tilapiae]|uniref:Restriction endonuclease n=1 Tax=Rheinheimera tilapiae TaxID=875043 RepID=A0ABV6BEN1_9GAMM